MGCTKSDVIFTKYFGIQFYSLNISAFGSTKYRTVLVYCTKYHISEILLLNTVLKTE